MDYEIHNGDCREIMASMDANSVDAIVTDPPYGLSFMGKGWDHAVPGVEFWAEALRVAKPGAHLVAFGGTRLYHRLTCAIEDAGWEVRDCLMWLYGSGFPKSHDVSKAIDREAGAEREVVGPSRKGAQSESTGRYGAWGDGIVPTAPATDAAKRWQGWGTALKPAWEPIVLARKPLAGTVASNVLEHGTGGINVDGCRVPMSDEDAETIRNMGGYGESSYERTPGEALNLNKNPMPCRDAEPHSLGRWPANLILDAEAGAALDGQFAGASRYFYCPKASKADRDEGLEDSPDDARRMFASGGRTMVNGVWIETNSEPQPRKNAHPTVKPTDLMRYLCRLITPPGGTVLDPFTGSGSTGKAATLEGFNFIGCELDATYCDTARRRIEHARTEAGLYATSA